MQPSSLINFYRDIRDPKPLWKVCNSRRIKIPKKPSNDDGFIAVVGQNKAAVLGCTRINAKNRRAANLNPNIAELCRGFEAFVSNHTKGKLNSVIVQWPRHSREDFCLRLQQTFMLWKAPAFVLPSRSLRYLRRSLYVSF